MSIKDDIVKDLVPSDWHVGGDQYTAAHHYSEKRGCPVMSLGDLHNHHTQRDSVLPGRDFSMKHC